VAKKKNPVTEYLSRIGRKGGRARVTKGVGALEKADRIELAHKAVSARWEAYYKAHPEKLKAKLERDARKGKVKRGRPPKKSR
jgi:hypothetical protein